MVDAGPVVVVTSTVVIATLPLVAVSPVQVNNIKQRNFLFECV